MEIIIIKESILDIYLDLLFIENAFIDFIIIYTMSILYRKINKTRILIVCVIGGFQATFLVMHIQLIQSICFKIFSLIIIIKILYNNKKMEFFKDIIVFLCITFIFSGACFSILTFFKGENFHISNGIIFGKDENIVFIMLSVSIAWIISIKGFSIIKRKKQMTVKDFFVEMIIKNINKTNCVIGYVDSGNFLKDPVTGKSVIILELKQLKKIINKNEYSFICDLLGGEKKYFKSLNDKIRAIPYTSVGNNNGLIFIYEIDSVRIKFQNEIYIFNKPIIGIFNNVLTKNGKYSSLIGLHLFERSI